MSKKKDIMSKKTIRQELAYMLRFEIESLKHKLPEFLEKETEISELTKTVLKQLENFKADIDNYQTNKLVEKISQRIIETENRIKDYATKYNNLVEIARKQLEKIPTDDLEELKPLITELRVSLNAMLNITVSLDYTIDELDKINDDMEILKDVTPDESRPEEALVISDFTLFKEEMKTEMAGLKQFVQDVEEIVGTPEWKLSLEKAILLEKIEANEKSIGNIFKNNRNLIAAISIVFAVMTAVYGGVIGWIINILFRVIELLNQ